MDDDKAIVQILTDRELIFDILKKRGMNPELDDTSKSEPWNPIRDVIVLEGAPDWIQFTFDKATGELKSIHGRDS